MRNISPMSGGLLAGLIVGFSLSASAEVDLSRLPPPSTRTDLTYTNDIRPIFQASCFRCHGGKQHRGGISLDSLDGVLRGGDDGTILTVGDGTNSQLVLAVSRLDPKTAMPPKRRPRGPGGPGGPGGPNGPGGPPPMDGRPPGAPGDNGPVGSMGTNSPARPPGPPAKPLTPEQVGLVRAWINQGAK